MKTCHQEIDTIGIIAGNRSLPLAFAEQARAKGVKRLVAIAFENETNPALAQKVDEIVWLKVGQLSKMIAALKDRGVAQCVMLGQIAPKNLFDVRPDLRAVSLLMKLKERNAHSIFGAIADELKKDGITLIEPIPWLGALMPSAGFTLGPRLSDEQKESRSPAKNTTCVSISPASARKHWKPAPPQKFQCSPLKPARHCCWSRNWSKRWPRNTKSP
jgi:DUF1009 family protein